jgi:hypothetical protein
MILHQLFDNLPLCITDNSYPIFVCEYNLLDTPNFFQFFTIVPCHNTRDQRQGFM